MDEKVKEIVSILCSKELDNYDANDVLVGATLFITGILKSIEGFKTPFEITFAELHDAIEEIIKKGIVNENDDRK